MSRLANTAVELANKHKIIIEHHDEMLKKVQLEKEQFEKKNHEVSGEQLLLLSFSLLIFIKYI